jgi:7-cyano-7-deazaguanine synthase
MAVSDGRSAVPPYSGRRIVIALLSGGLDSSTMCAVLVDRGWSVLPLFVNYGQRALRAERLAVSKVVKLLKLRAHREVNIHGLSGRHVDLLGSCRATKRSAAVLSPDQQFVQAFVPQRNLLLLTIASMVAYQNDSLAIAIGTIDAGAAGYVDTTPAYLRRAAALLRRCQPIQVMAPFAGWTKERVVRAARRHRFDYDVTHSCVVADRPCGACASCVDRIASIGLLSP